MNARADVPCDVHVEEAGDRGPSSLCLHG
ncbi:hypothetical protein GA0115255_1222519, partial [Streptomyces sp. Ncost-T6T-2b]